mmetsp:Transcript_6831/g.14809  ORF Transcript_6831/g.14809 Transcript_6831/m.14809 type:complete len:100 (+) Transcript_6831:36-335(+)
MESFSCCLSEPHQTFRLQWYLKITVKRKSQCFRLTIDEPSSMTSFGPFVHGTKFPLMCFNATNRPNRDRHITQPPPSPLNAPTFTAIKPYFDFLWASPC